MALEFDILIRRVASIFPLVYKAGFSKLESNLSKRGKLINKKLLESAQL
jgi:hypothetical protein